MNDSSGAARCKPVLVIGGGVAGQRAAVDLADAGIPVLLLERADSIGGTVAQLGAMFPLHNCLLCRGVARHGAGCTRPTIASELLDHSRPDHLSVWTQSELAALEGQPGSYVATIQRNPRYVDASRCIDCRRCAQVCPKELPNAHEAGLSGHRAAHKPSFRSVPDAYVIEKGDYCQGCRRCAEVCPTKAIDLLQPATMETVAVSAIVVATGMQLHDAASSQEYGYGRFPNVFTGLEMERMASPDGPGEGRIVRRSDGQAPAHIAWFQCVGSRDSEHDYCSSFCCSYATRQAVLARQILPEARASIYVMDDRVFAKSFSATYHPLRVQFGISLSRNRPSVIREDPDTHDLIVQVTAEDGGVVDERFSMVVLSIGAEGARNTDQLAAILGLQSDAHRFVRTLPLTPVDTVRPGIYVAGSAIAPADVADSVSQGSAAAARVRSFLGYPTTVRIPRPQQPDLVPGAGQQRRIGVFVCDCAGEVGRVVDLPGLLRFAGSLPQVTLCQVLPFGCLPEGLATMRHLIASHRLTDVVVGACNPRTYGALFTSKLPSAVRFVSLREECAYVHQDDPTGATRLAKEQLRVAVNRVRTRVPAIPHAIQPVRAALVVGAGLAGLIAALYLADGGIDVHVIERSSVLGGQALRLGLTAEGEDVPAHVRGLVARARDHSRIHLYTSTEVMRVSGQQGDFKASLRARNEVDGDREVHVGAIVAATGGDEYRGDVYALGKSPQVCTLLDLQRRLAAEPGLATQFRQVAFIGCVGPWDEPNSAQRWRCSRTCCEGIVRQALAIKSANPACQVIVSNREVNTYALREELYTAARKSGVLFVRSSPGREPVVEMMPAGLRLTVHDSTLQETLELHPDLLALGVAIVPRGDASQTAASLGIPHDPGGFLREWETKVFSHGTLEPGVFVCGLAHGPKPSRETIVQALAAADHALTLLSRGQISASGAVATVDRSKCVGCLTCLRTCPYSVPRMTGLAPYQRAKSYSSIDPLRCQGCGTCVVDCPRRAIQLEDCQDEQLLGDRLLGQWLVAG